MKWSRQVSVVRGILRIKVSPTGSRLVQCHDIVRYIRGPQPLRITIGWLLCLLVGYVGGGRRGTGPRVMVGAVGEAGGIGNLRPPPHGA